MAVFKRGKVYWYEFRFGGIRIRASSCSTIREVAARAERERRRSLELGANNLEPVKRARVLSIVAKEWIAGSPHWSPNTRRINSKHLEHLLPILGGLLLNEVRPAHIQRYQSNRLHAGASPKTINLEIAALRQVIRQGGYWSDLQGKIKMLPTRQDAGRALTPDEISRLEVAAEKTRSRSLRVVLTLLRFTGMRISELRLMRWRQIDLLEHYLIVGAAKTKGSAGRMIPLAPSALQALLAWRSKFPDAKPNDYVFPSERYGLDGENGHEDGSVTVYHITPDKPITSWKAAWATCKETAGVQCRLHDYRHTFVSRLAEGQISDATLMALTGHLTKRMLEHYSHTRVQAKRDAIQTLEFLESPQQPPH